MLRIWYGRLICMFYNCKPITLYHSFASKGHGITHQTHPHQMIKRGSTDHCDVHFLRFAVAKCNHGEIEIAIHTTVEIDLATAATSDALHALLEIGKTVLTEVML